jgi:hypothetical protein
MATNTFPFKLSSSQRYFHLIVFKPDGKNYSLEEFWKDAKILVKNLDKKIYSSNELKIQVGKYVTDTPLYSDGDGYSVIEGTTPPYHYDILAMEIKTLNSFVLGFPFKTLAKIVVSNLIDKSGIFSKGSFIKPNLDKLIRINNNDDFSYNRYSSWCTDLTLNISSDENLSSINLDGDYPLDSALYKDVFLNLIKKKEATVDRCTLKFLTELDESGQIPITKSNIHADLFGNYKLYVHSSVKNIFTIPFLLDLLEIHDCGIPVKINPIPRIKEEKKT